MKFIAKKTDNGYQLEQHVNLKEFKNVMYRNSYIATGNYTWHDGDFLKHFINRYKDTGCVILSTERDREKEGNEKNTRYFEHILTVIENVAYQIIDAVYIYKNDEVKNEVFFVIPFKNLKDYSLAELMKFCSECINGYYNAGLEINQECYFLVHPDFNYGKPCYIYSSGKTKMTINNNEEEIEKDEQPSSNDRIISLDEIEENKSCLFYFKENINYMNSWKKKWKYLDTSR